MRRSSFPLLALSILACGGKVVVDAGQGGAGSTSAESNASTGAPSSVGPGPSVSSGGPTGCTKHTDCTGTLCIFATGTCAPACEVRTCDDCGPGLVCNGCATSSCPECEDCRAACVAPTTVVACDDSNPCPPGQACQFGLGQCAPTCDAAGGCPDPSLVCVGCATGSCCGCDDCVSLCLPLEG